MDAFWKGAVWGQFGAAIECLERAIDACPDERWADRSQPPDYWYVVYHTLFFLDYYLHDHSTPFAPPAPYTLGELDPEGVIPDRVYTRAEMQSYLEHGRAKCRAWIAALTDEQVRRQRSGPLEGLTEGERLLSSLRHVQHHTAQLNLMLRHSIDSAPRWVRTASLPLESA